jgi:ribosome-binding protein aMBF1 (putative translation factor)
MVFCSPGFGARTTFYNRPTFRDQAKGILSQGLFMPSTLLSHAFGAVVRCKRQELGLSQEDLAERAQVHADQLGFLIL